MSGQGDKGKGKAAKYKAGSGDSNRPPQDQPRPTQPSAPAQSGFGIYTGAGLPLRASHKAPRHLVEEADEGAVTPRAGSPQRHGVLSTSPEEVDSEGFSHKQMEKAKRESTISTPKRGQSSGKLRSYEI